MLKLSDDSCFAQQPGRELAAGIDDPDRFESDLTVESRVLDAIDSPHATFAEFLQQSITRAAEVRVVSGGAQTIEGSIRKPFHAVFSR